MNIQPSKDYPPFGGYVYPQKMSDGTLTILADYSWEGLAHRVLHFRLQNGLETGDPLREVTAHYCWNHPEGCKDIDPVEAPPFVPSMGAPLPVRVAEWLRRIGESLVKDGRDPVTAAQTAATASACKGCENQQDWGCMACGGLSKHLQFAGYTVRAGQEVPDHQELRGCRITGVDTRTLPFVGAKNRPEVPADQQELLPAHCPLKIAAP